MSKTPGTELDRTTQALTLEQVEEVLLHGGELAVLSPDAVQDDMVQRILASETATEAFASFTATPAADMEGQRIEVRGIAWMRSAFDQGPKVYALLDAVVVQTGEPVTISMGGRTTMASFLWAQRHQAMPFAGTFRKERSNTNTERAYWTFKLADGNVG